MVKLMLNDDERAIVDIVSSEKTVKKLPERIPIDFVINNGICYLFYKKVGDMLDSKDLEQIHEKVEETKLLIEEVYNLSKIFKEHNIGFTMRSKAIESQCDSHEVDVSVKDRQMEKMKNILEKLGYISAPWGWVGAYAKKVGEIILHVDIASEEDKNDIVFDGRKRKKREIDGIFTLSPEDELSGRILKPIEMRSARIALCDIIHLSNLLEKYNIHQLPKNIKKSWFVPCLHSIYLINILYKTLYSRDIRAPVVEQAKEFHNRSRIWNTLSKIETRKVNLPFHSRIFSYSSLTYKLLYDLSHFNFKEIVRSIISLINHITIPVSNTYISIISLRRILKRKRIVVCFTGIDGTGKTSHATKIVKTFKNMGIPCQYVWCNWVPRVSYPLMALVYLVTGGYRRKDYHKSKILRKIWNYVVIFDFIYLYFFKVKIPLFIGKNVVCDRYVYDMIADLEYDGLYNKKASKILLKLIPEPDLVFMLDIPEDISDLRKDDTKGSVNIKDSDSAIDYLRNHRRNYLKIAKLLGIPVIDSTGDLDSLHEEIYKKVVNTYINKQSKKGMRSEKYSACNLG